LPAGRDFGPVRTCGAFPPTAARRAPHRSRSHGRLRRPKSLPIRHSPAAEQCRPPLGWRDCPCFDLFAASIRKSGLEIKNRCTDCPCFDLLAASIRKSGLEIENRCTDCPRFDLLAASIRKSRLEIKNRCTDCPCFDLMAAPIRKSGLEIENRCSAIVPASRTVPPTEGRCRIVERPACSTVVGCRRGQDATKAA
ncbi:MAG: hypothetical protein PUK15_04700, partial [Bacteroidales bacterium]|nr:hypothetical protein [Bacteroidales bacterium]